MRHTGKHRADLFTHRTTANALRFNLIVPVVCINTNVHLTKNVNNYTHVYILFICYTRSSNPQLRFGHVKYSVRRTSVTKPARPDNQKPQQIIPNSAQIVFRNLITLFITSNRLPAIDRS